MSFRNKKKEYRHKFQVLQNENEELKKQLSAIQSQCKTLIKNNTVSCDKKINVQIQNTKRKLLYKIHKYCPNEKRPIALADWYYETTGKVLNLDNPQTFNEKIQWMKLYDSTPIKTQLADKYLVRSWITEKIGDEYLIPLLGVWDRFEDIDFDSLPNQFVLKCNHGCGYNIIVKDKSKLNIDEARKKINNWLNEDFAFRCGFEMHYSAIPRKIIAEKYIEPNISNVEVQMWCFNGNIEFISYENCKVNKSPARCILSTNWIPEDFKVSPNHYSEFEGIPTKPKFLNDLIEKTKLLCKNFAYVRVDWILCDNKFYFREMTFTSGSGLSVFEPKEKSLELGKLINIEQIKERR